MKRGKKDKKKTKKDDGVRERMDALKRECKEKADLAEQYLKQLEYLQADFENLQKRVERDRSEYVKNANEGLIKELLPVLDSLEKASEMTGHEKDANGIARIYDQFHGVLDRNGLRKIDAVGKKFDPYCHEVASREKSKEEEDTVLEELQKGYMLNSKVIRHSMVKVSGGK